MSSRALRRLGGWTICALGAGLALSACSNDLHGTASGGTTTVTVTSSPSADADHADDNSSGSATTTKQDNDSDSGGSGSGGSGSSGGSGNSGGSGSSGGGGSSGSGGSEGHSSAPSAKVLSLVVTSKPSCPVVGTTDAPFSAPGHDVTIAWKVSGANGAAIGVDNPHTYGAYGSDYNSTGSESFSFGCDTSQNTTTHTFTVWPKGHPETSKTITVSAQSNP